MISLTKHHPALQLRDRLENPGYSIGKCRPVLASQCPASQQNGPIGAPKAWTLRQMSVPCQKRATVETYLVCRGRSPVSWRRISSL